MSYASRLVGIVMVMAASISYTAKAHGAPASSGPPKIERDGTLKIAGRNLRCGRTRNVLDRHLPSEGAAAPGVLIINPRLINRMPETVRVFVYYHECGHHNIGASELGADCWAVERGVSEGWLDRNGLQQVCRSFGDMPATATHPSGRSRCRNLDRCYASAVAKLQKQKPAEQKEAAAEQKPSDTASPTLVSGPQLIGSGTAEAEEEKTAFRNRPRNRSVR